MAWLNIILVHKSRGYSIYEQVKASGRLSLKNTPMIRYILSVEDVRRYFISLCASENFKKLFHFCENMFISPTRLLKNTTNHQIYNCLKEMIAIFHTL